MCIHFIDTFNELKVLRKYKLWWIGSLNERNSVNVPLDEPHALPDEIFAFIYKYWLINTK